MKDTPIQTVIKQIENAKSPLETDEAKGYNIGLEIALTFIRAQLPYEMECIDDAYRTGFENGLYKNPIGHEEYIKNNFNQTNPQGGGGE